MINMRKASFL